MSDYFFKLGYRYGCSFSSVLDIFTSIKSLILTCIRCYNIFKDNKLAYINFFWVFFGKYVAKEGVLPFAFAARLMGEKRIKSLTISTWCSEFLTLCWMSIWIFMIYEYYFGRESNKQTLFLPNAITVEIVLVVIGNIELKFVLLTCEKKFDCLDSCLFWDKNDCFSIVFNCFRLFSAASDLS